MKYNEKNKDINYVLNLALPGEVFKQVTSRIVKDVYDYYQISNFGRVYHNYLKIIMKPGLSTSGYLFIVMRTRKGSKIIQLHRLVLIAFNDICDREKYDVNHINGNKQQNYLYNLEWATRSDNILHAYNTGLHPLGENNTLSKITEETAKNICELLQSNKYTNKEIAEMTNSTISIVSDIKKGKNWRYVSKNYNFISRPRKLFTDIQINNLCKYFQNNNIGNLTINDHCRNALLYYNYDISDKSIDSIRKLYTRKYYTKISKNYTF